MPATKRPKPIYQRGEFKLFPREGRNHEIVWYDTERKRERSASAGTSDATEAKKALDRHYLKAGGVDICPTCHRPLDAHESPRVISVIGDYLIRSEGKAGEHQTKSRMAHVIAYLIDKPETRCSAVDAQWIAAFRKHLAAKPVIDRYSKKERPRSLGDIEGIVRQFAAAINAAPGQEAQFKAAQPKDVSRSPRYRADVATIARMFNYCLRPDEQTEKLRISAGPNATACSNISAWRSPHGRDPTLS